MNPESPTPETADQVKITPEIVDQMFQVFTSHLRAAADTLIQLIQPQVNLPEAAKARYMAIDKIQEAHMWAGNGVAALLQALNKPQAPSNVVPLHPEA